MLKRRALNTLTIGVLTTLAITSFFVPVSWWWFVLTVFSWLVITLFGSFLIRWNYHLKSYHSNKTIDENWVSITFDDGPNTEFTPKVLKLLKQYNAKATFFCIGKQVEKHPTILLDIIDHGHSIGNHTYSHSKSFGFFGLNRVIEELRKTNMLVKDLTGLEMKLYRPCFGVTNPQIEKAVKARELYSIGWNVRSLDTTPRTASNILKRITSRISKGDVVLLHDTSEKTIAVLEQLLLFLQENHLQSVPVDKLLQLKAYA
ncbi:polysaccharide deacetylase family protein [Flavobacteriaceae bacterium TP-CH-4]|uniref:Polysaccharide deacetylase family protein n=1 Tax=Pelagihabitans pacificus TaxID=2696054 RepID=A0A967AWB4_9FLAO|nr:polysaccharide deacetylase family protein [Pelagihabitans pacificus]NHF60560.1 polysaccharide deacetylase family protein [Pelagihabitans pacificus]